MQAFRSFTSNQIRLLGLGLLVAGLFVAHSRFPTRQVPDWDTVRGFELDGGECEAFFRARSTTELRVTPEEDAPQSIAEAAQMFRLELPLVCQCNDLQDACGDLGLTPGGEPLLLPLYRDPQRLKEEEESPESVRTSATSALPSPAAEPADPEPPSGQPEGDS